MRADIQIIISEIDKSLSLLRQRLDWDNVRKKREEFDALTEDPDLWNEPDNCLLYTSPSPRDKRQSRMPSSA